MPQEVEEVRREFRVSPIRKVNKSRSSQEAFMDKIERIQTGKYEMMQLHPNPAKKSDEKIETEFVEKLYPAQLFVDVPQPNQRYVHLDQEEEV